MLLGTMTFVLVIWLSYSDEIEPVVRAKHVVCFMRVHKKCSVGGKAAAYDARRGREPR